MPSYFDDYETIEEFKPKHRKGLLNDFEYVADIPTVAGQFQEGGTALLRGVGTSAVVAPLKGASVFETFREKIVDKKIGEEIDRQFERAKNPIRPGDRTNSVRELRRIANLYLGKDERKELWDIANQLDKGETSQEELKKRAKEKLPFYVPPKMPSERGAYKAGEKVEKFLEKQLPVTPGYEETLGVEIGGAIGSTAGSIAQSLVGGPVTLLAGSALQGIDEQFDRAKKAGLKEEEAINFAMKGAGPGAIGTLSAEYILRKLPPKIRSQVLRTVTDVGLAGGAEAVTEGLQQTIQNAIEMQYNPERKIFDGTPFAATLGGGVGMVLRGVVLGATRGRGVGADGGAPDPVAVQQELAAEEYAARQSGVADAETHEPGKEPQRAETPKEAAEKGEVKAPGKPVTIIYGTGERVEGYELGERDDGGYDFVDRDGLKSVLEPEDFESEAILGKEDGWRKPKPDADIEKDLKEWLTGQNPWPKVTVETLEGFVFKAIEGPPDAAGNRTFRDGNADFISLDPDSIAVNPGWDADALEAPPKIGKVAEKVNAAPGLLPGDAESPLSNADISAGRQVAAEAEGAVNANAVLSEAGLPPVGTPVMLKEGSVSEPAAIVDATDTTVKVLTSAGVNIEKKFGEIAPNITVIPADMEAAEIELPGFLKPGGTLTERTKPRTAAPKGETVPAARVSGAAEARVAAPKGEIVPVAKVRGSAEARTGTPTGEEVPELKIKAGPEARIETPKGQPVPAAIIQAAEQARAKAPVAAAIEPTKFLDELAKTISKSEVRTDVPEGVMVRDDREEREKGGARVEDRQGARDETKQQGRPAQAAPARVRDTEIQGTPEKEQVNVRQDEVKVRRKDEEAARADARTSEVEQVQNAVRRGDIGEDEGRKGQGQRVRAQDVGGAPAREETTAPTRAVAATEPAAAAQEAKQATWWDNSSPEQRTAAIKSIYSELPQRREYTKRSWSDLPQPAKADIIARNADAIAAVATKAEARAEPEISVEAAKSQGMLFRKSGAPYSSPDSAMMTYQPATHEPVKVEGGWAVRKKEGVPAPTEPAVAKAETPTPSRVKPVKQAQDYVKEGDFYLNKDKKGFATKAQATSVAIKLGGAKSGLKVTQDAITDNRGWVVKQEQSFAKQEAQAPEAAPAKPVVKRVSKKEFDAKRAAVNASLREELNKRGLSDVKLSTPETITELGGDKAKSRIATVGRSVDDLIEVALAGDHDVRKVFDHENIHTIRRFGLFKDSEWKVLSREAQADKALMADVKERYADENLNQDALIEEAVADKFADYVEGNSKPKGFVRTAFEKLRNFIRALGNALRGNGFKSASDVFQSIERGEVGARPRRDTARQTAYSEEQAGIAIEHLNDPSGGLLSPAKYAKIARHQDQIIKDMGVFKKWTLSPRMIAALSRSFAPVYKAAKRQFAFRDSLISNLVTEYTPYRKLSRARKEKVNKVLELGRLEQTVYTPAANGSISVTASRKTGTMEAGETVTLSAEEVEAYQSVRSMLDSALDQFRDQTVRDFGYDPALITNQRQALGLIQPGMKFAEVKKIRNLAKMVNDINQSKRAGYVPFTRFGNVVVVAERTDPVTGKKTTLHSETIEAVTQAQAFKKAAALEKELEQRYPGADTGKFQVAGKGQGGKDSQSGGDVLSELIQLPAADLQEAVQKMQNEALSKGFRKHFLGSKNIPGYSVDFERSLADYAITLGGFIARRHAEPEWRTALDAIPKHKVKEREYANKYREYVNSPQEEYAAVRQAGFVMLLMGNISNGVANATQVPLITAPYMTMFSNPARVEFELARAYKDVAKMLGGGVENMFNPDRAPADVRSDLKKAWDAGEFSPLAMHDIMGVAYKSRASARALSAAARKTVDYMAIPQTLTERTNRLVTYIAAHRLASKDPQAFAQKAQSVLKGNELANVTVLQNFSPDAFGRFLVDETQYDVGKINRATMMRGAGAAIFQFKPFIAHTLELQYRLAAKHGMQGKKAFGLMILGMIGSAGLWSIPGVDDSSFLLEQLMNWWDGADRDIKASSREAIIEMAQSPFIAQLMERVGIEDPATLAQLMMQGSHRALGIDMTNRVGLGKIVPRSFEEWLGVPFGIWGQRVVPAATLAKDGRIVEAAAQALPLFAKNFTEQWVWSNAGVRTRLGDPVMPAEEITESMRVAKGFGFTPAKVSERREMEWSQQRAGKAVQNLTAKYYRSMARALNDANNAALEDDDATFDENMDKFEKLMLEIEEHNDKVLEKDQLHKLIIIDETALQKRMAAEQQGRNEVRLSTAPVKARQRQQEIGEIYGDTR